MRIDVPVRTRLSLSVGISITDPNTVTGLAAQISWPWLAGVRPKKMHNADPGDQ